MCAYYMFLFTVIICLYVYDVGCLTHRKNKMMRFHLGLFCVFSFWTQHSAVTHRTL